MAGKIDKDVKYKIDQEDKMKFIIENYNGAKPFSSFFPGIAGLMGIPLWCFYVNRGQCVAGFGTESKDGAIMEFQPANKACRIVGTQGFRTFIKYREGNETFFYEPFQYSQAFSRYEVENKMSISPYDLEIEEINKTLGLSVKVRYFTIPNEPVAALAREVAVTNLSERPVNLEIVDGMPVINLYGLSDGYIKNMSRTMEAWAYVENLENGVPFYRLKVLPNDSSEIVPVEKGNFYMSFIKGDNGMVQLAQPVIDPAAVFGHVLDFSYPHNFIENTFTVKDGQHYENRTPSAMGYARLQLQSGTGGSVYSLIGHSASLKELNSLTPGFMEEGFFERKSFENAELIKELMDKSFVSSSSDALDAYAKQNFLDNVLRGGYPMTLEAKGVKDVLYIYSRRHGDLERDYNSFRLMPTYFSQGNGAYRDINQNRRNDIWFNADVGYTNIQYFMNLIQLDGYNPLIVKGLSYVYKKDDNSSEKLAALVDREHMQKLVEFLEKPFIPYNLIRFIQDESIELKVSLQDFICEMIQSSSKVEEAEHGEGYWSDHWFYNTDLLESYAALFPDRMKELLVDMKTFSFYDDGYYVLPRKSRYVLHKNGEPRQFGSVRKIPEKLKLIEDRIKEPNKVRTNYGNGDIYNTTLLSKLLTLCVCKIASLDANGTGVEMEADKPNWDDAMNGLPALFGSSASETFELLRLTQLLIKWIADYRLEEESIFLPEEVYQFYAEVYDLLEKNLKDGSSDCEFQYWKAASSVKEKYREKVLYGIDGKEAGVLVSQVSEFFELCSKKLNRAKEKAYNKELGIYNTYFINRPLDYKSENGFIEVKSFEQIPLPAFLEGQVHALKIEKSREAAEKLYISVRYSDLYDKKLGMYKVNGSLSGTPMEIGRIRAFTPGWLENESIFLHMEYKYLLEIIKSGLCDEYYLDSANALVPYLKPEAYGRSIFENSSFIASSANPDESVHGNGFVARLSGTTAEFYNILLIMAVGKSPFSTDEKGSLNLEFKPLLNHRLFTWENKRVEIYRGKDKVELLLDKNTFSFCFLGKTILVYHNPKRLNTYGTDAVSVSRIELWCNDKIERVLTGKTIPDPYSGEIRDGIYSRIDVWLE